MTALQSLWLASAIAAPPIDPLPREVDPIAIPDQAPPTVRPPTPTPPSLAPDLVAPAPAPEPEALPRWDPSRHGPEALRARHFLRAGIVLTSAAVALGIGAAIFASTDPCTPAAGNGCQRGARDRAVWTMAAPALALGIGGVTMLTYGAVRIKELRAQVTAHGFSIGVGGSF